MMRLPLIAAVLLVFVAFASAVPHGFPETISLEGEWAFV